MQAEGAYGTNCPTKKPKMADAFFIGMALDGEVKDIKTIYTQILNTKVPQQYYPTYGCRATGEMHTSHEDWLSLECYLI